MYNKNVQKQTSKQDWFWNRSGGFPGGFHEHMKEMLTEVSTYIFISIQFCKWVLKNMNIYHNIGHTDLNKPKNIS